MVATKKKLGTLSTVKNVGLVVLGDEECHNSWINPYLVSNGGPVKKQVENRVIYQWPLGVAIRSGHLSQFP